MHDGSMMAGGGLWLGMRLWWILILVLVVLGIAALARYVFGGRN
ncbi:hypothetical protein [Acidiphilium sp.]|nr:hypothetical protein [Acidiphilium sp.]